MKLKNLKTKFILVYLGVLSTVFLIMLTVIMIGMRIYTSNYIKNNITDIQMDIDESITSVVNEVAYLYARITKSENVSLLNEINNAPNTIDQESAFEELINKAGINPDYFKNITLIVDEDILSLEAGSLPQTKYLEKIKASRNRLVLLETVENNLVIGLNMELDITSLKGIFLFHLNGDLLNSLCNSPSLGSGYSFIVGTDSYILTHQNSELAGKKVELIDIEAINVVKTGTIDNEKKVIMTGEMSKLKDQYNFDCLLISIFDHDVFYGELNNLVKVLFFVILLIFVAAVIIAIFRARKITSPIHNLNKNIEEVITTGKKSQKVAKSGDEIFQLEKNYDEMMDTIFELVEKNRQEAEMQRKLELYSLQMQINPHFLYNTLDAIAWMAKIKKQPEIEKLVLNLANFFRLSLHKGDKYVTINNEIELLKSYLEIYKIRFPEKVTFVLNLEPGIGDYQILKLLLQPIVENSLKHAFPEKPGTIAINAYSKAEDIYFEVLDDGIGFEVPEDIFALKNQEALLHGYGLFNVNERIRLGYGDDYGLIITSKPGSGTKIIIKIKKLTDVQE